jgi:hypothetical protein
VVGGPAVAQPRWLVARPLPIGQTSLNTFGGIANPASGNVLTDPDGSTVNGTQLVMGTDRGDLSGPWHVSFHHYLGH